MVSSRVCVWEQVCVRVCGMYVQICKCVNEREAREREREREKAREREGEGESSVNRGMFVTG